MFLAWKQHKIKVLHRTNSWSTEDNEFKANSLFICCVHTFVTIWFQTVSSAATLHHNKNIWLISIPNQKSK